MDGKDEKVNTRSGNYAKCQDRTTDHTKKCEILLDRKAHVNNNCNCFVN
mgnify:CR=1 FL=1